MVEKAQGYIRPGDSRTDYIQATLRSDRFMSRIPGCKEGSSIPTVMEAVADPNSLEHVEQVARFWRSVHQAWMGPLASSFWEEEL